MNHVHHTAPDAHTLSHPAGEILDVRGRNEYLGGYTGRLEDTDMVQWKST
jgi:hypothetical protein